MVNLQSKFHLQRVICIRDMPVFFVFWGFFLHQTKADHVSHGIITKTDVGIHDFCEGCNYYVYFGLISFDSKLGGWKFKGGVFHVFHNQLWLQMAFTFYFSPNPLQTLKEDIFPLFINKYFSKVFWEFRNLYYMESPHLGFSYCFSDEVFCTVSVAIENFYFFYFEGNKVIS